MAIIRNNCVKENTLLFEIDGVCTPPSFNTTQPVCDDTLDLLIIDKLDDMADMSKKCCDKIVKLLTPPRQSPPIIIRVPIPVYIEVRTTVFKYLPYSPRPLPNPITEVIIPKDIRWIQSKYSGWLAKGPDEFGRTYYKPIDDPLGKRGGVGVITEEQFIKRGGFSLPLFNPTPIVEPKPQPTKEEIKRRNNALMLKSVTPYPTHTNYQNNWRGKNYQKY